jgi:hypothetical protein
MDEKAPTPTAPELNAQIRAEEFPPVSVVNVSTKDEMSSLFGDDGRKESLKQTIHQAIIWGLRLAAICLILSFIVRVFHLAAPTQWLWLDEARLQKLDSILFGYSDSLVVPSLQG